MKTGCRQAYEIIKNSMEDDLHNAYDKQTGMVKGESSFLDWREQTYPKWMQPADIYESECLGTNAVHYQANIVLSEMATLLNDEHAAKKYKAVAERIKAGINKYLWMPQKDIMANIFMAEILKFFLRDQKHWGSAFSFVWYCGCGKAKAGDSKNACSGFWNSLHLPPNTQYSTLS